MRSLSRNFLYLSLLTIELRKKLIIFFLSTQRKGESLKSSVKKFNQEIIETVNYDESIVVTTFRKGMSRGNLLYYSFANNKTQTMVESLLWARRYINLEDHKQEKYDYTNRGKEKRNEEPKNK